jgi:hypothetical protein
MKNMTDLRSKLIRLAHEKPELRPHLLPILAKSAALKLRPGQYVQNKDNSWSKLSAQSIYVVWMTKDGEVHKKAFSGMGAANQFYGKLDPGGHKKRALLRAPNDEAADKILQKEWGKKPKTASDKEAMRGRFTLPRGSYLPKNNATLMERKGTPEGLQIWTWEDIGRNGSPVYLAGAWAGKADKPMWYHTFRDINGQERQIQDTVKLYQDLVDAKRKRLEDQKNFAHGLQIGDILVSSWGYDQTNVDYYQVTRLYGKAIGIREIGKKYLSSDGSGSDKVAPDQGAFVGPEMKKIPRGGYGGASVKINSFASAHKWDGQPDRQTSSGWGH